MECRCCGADLSREDHDRDCENAPDREWAERMYWEAVDNYRELGYDPNAYDEPGDYDDDGGYSDPYDDR